MTLWKTLALSEFHILIYVPLTTSLIVTKFSEVIAIEGNVKVMSL